MLLTLRKLLTKQKTKFKKRAGKRWLSILFVSGTRLIMKGGDGMSRILTYAAGLFTGVLAGMLGTAILVSYTETIAPGTGTKFSAYMDAMNH